MQFNLIKYPAFFDKIYRMGYEDGLKDAKINKEKKISSQN